MVPRTRDQCAGCGAILRLKPKIPGVCPYCGGGLSTGRNSWQAVEPAQDPQREAQRRHSRTWGAVQLVGGVLLVALLWPRAGLAMFGAGMLAAHGLYRILFASGPNRDDDDYDDARRD